MALENMSVAERNLERFIDFTVLDNHGNKVGTVESIWEDHTGEPAFLGVRTGWLGLGKMHVVPAFSAQVSKQTQNIRLPFTEQVLKDAPSYESQSEINDSTEKEIYEYYRTHGLAVPYYEESRDWTPSEVEEDIGKRERFREEHTIPLREEELKVGKREVEDRGVRLRKIVRTETVNKPVELKREELIIESTPGRGDVGDSGPIREEEIFIPLRREEPVIEKETRIRENIHLGKKETLESTDVSGEIHSEDLEVEDRDGDRDLTR